MTDFEKNDDVIIDTLPPDYSILEEIDYKYPADNAYLGYTTRGCIIPHILEPEYKNYLLYNISATKEKFWEFDSMVHSLFEKYFKCPKYTHYIDFNQGLDARLFTEENAAKLSEINVRPLRIAFDHYEQRDI